jgi:hypothetical protein
MLSLMSSYFSMRYDVDFLLTKQSIIHIKHWRYAFYIHIFLSIFSLIAGFTQFSSFVLRKWKKLHRAMGYIYIVDVIFLAGPSGLIMGFYANGTVWAKVSFVLLSFLWIVFTGIAFIKVKEKNFISHRKWMTRSYALTLSAISLRLFAMVIPKFIHMNAFDEYTLLAWLSWTLNLLIAEIIIFSRERRRLLA